jgi:NAD-dependent SIR2 family protein deacetylase
VIELHGSLHNVICLGCGGEESRTAIQSLLEQANPELLARSADAAPTAMRSSITGMNSSLFRRVRAAAAR